ncbi:MAG: diaminopimelate epimerase [Bacteroidaceae bacterium]|nr:diaminopimelate epimerase [Bacteroidaceae bacterium]
MPKIQFTKMHGAGNDYIYVDTTRFPIDHPQEAAIRWSRPHTGVGSDGLILIGTSDKADFSMRMFNNDGSEGRMCGNGVRCVGKYVYDHGMTHNKTVTIETLAGIKTLQLFTDQHNRVEKATVDMGTPILNDKTQLATEDGSLLVGNIEAERKTYQGTFVSMGNPHFVIFVNDITNIALETEGPALEHHPMFPEGCNIEFVQVLPDGALRTRVWERGTGITLACGTGACATAVAASLNGKSGRKSSILMDGGQLDIEWDEQNNHVFMTGPAATVFEGELEID